MANGDRIAPSVPAGLDAAAARTSVWLSWDHSTDAVGVAGYRVLRGGVVVLTVRDPWANVTNLKAGTSYTFEVVAFDAAGNTSARSAPLVVRTRRTQSAATTLSAVRRVAARRGSVALDVATSSYVVVDGRRRVRADRRGRVTVSGLRPGSEHAFIVRSTAGGRDRSTAVRLLVTAR